eukprot:TRINITY_DN17236_c0_g1_i1.p1 TRINITY_DN17236_c0_g1~~TRINITY_DN17236_c0_g1_i1.p1  ORF type:complete len:1394 (+),score=309.62 TRINITY_DN17236_c0_g1_i1:79-4260(+)
MPTAVEEYRRRPALRARSDLEIPVLGERYVEGCLGRLFVRCRRAVPFSFLPLLALFVASAAVTPSVGPDHFVGLQWSVDRDNVHGLRAAAAAREDAARTELQRYAREGLQRVYVVYQAKAPGHDLLRDHAFLAFQKAYEAALLGEAATATHGTVLPWLWSLQRYVVHPEGEEEGGEPGDVSYTGFHDWFVDGVHGNATRNDTQPPPAAAVRSQLTIPQTSDSALVDFVEFLIASSGLYWQAGGYNSLPRIPKHVIVRFAGDDALESVFAYHTHLHAGWWGPPVACISVFFSVMLLTQSFIQSVAVSTHLALILVLPFGGAFAVETSGAAQVRWGPLAVLYPIILDLLVFYTYFVMTGVMPGGVGRRTDLSLSQRITLCIRDPVRHGLLGHGFALLLCFLLAYSATDDGLAVPTEPRAATLAVAKVIGTSAVLLATLHPGLLAWHYSYVPARTGDPAVADDDTSDRRASRAAWTALRGLWDVRRRVDADADGARRIPELPCVVERPYEDDPWEFWAEVFCCSRMSSFGARVRRWVSRRPATAQDVDGGAPADDAGSGEFRVGYIGDANGDATGADISSAEMLRTLSESINRSQPLPPVPGPVPLPPAAPSVPEGRQGSSEASSASPRLPFRRTSRRKLGGDGCVRLPVSLTMEGTPDPVLCAEKMRGAWRMANGTAPMDPAWRRTPSVRTDSAAPSLPPPPPADDGDGWPLWHAVAMTIEASGGGDGERVRTVRQVYDAMGIVDGRGFPFVAEALTMPVHAGGDEPFIPAYRRDVGVARLQREAVGGRPQAQAPHESVSEAIQRHIGVHVFPLLQRFRYRLALLYTVVVVVVFLCGHHGAPVLTALASSRRVDDTALDSTSRNDHVGSVHEALARGVFDADNPSGWTACDVCAAPPDEWTRGIPVLRNASTTSSVAPSGEGLGVCAYVARGVDTLLQTTPAPTPTVCGDLQWSCPQNRHKCTQPEISAVCLATCGLCAEVLQTSSPAPTVDPVAAVIDVGLTTAWRPVDGERALDAMVAFVKGASRLCWIDTMPLRIPPDEAFCLRMDVAVKEIRSAGDDAEALWTAVLPLFEASTDRARPWLGVSARCDADLSAADGAQYAVPQPYVVAYIKHVKSGTTAAAPRDDSEFRFTASLTYSASAVLDAAKPLSKWSAGAVWDFHSDWAAGVAKSCPACSTGAWWWREPAHVVYLMGKYRALLFLGAAAGYFVVWWGTMSFWLAALCLFAVCGAETVHIALVSGSAINKVGVSELLGVLSVMWASLGATFHVATCYRLGLKSSRSRILASSATKQRLLRLALSRTAPVIVTAFIATLPILILQSVEPTTGPRHLVQHVLYGNAAAVVNGVVFLPALILSCGPVTLPIKSKPWLGAAARFVMLGVLFLFSAIAFAALL